jgi:hypothetical protein
VAKKNEVDLKYWLQTFGKPQGHRVLRDLLKYPTEAQSGMDKDSILISHGRKEVIEFIKDRLKAACGKNKKPYADIMYEVEVL